MTSDNGFGYERVETVERLREFHEVVGTVFVGGGPALDAWVDAFRSRLAVDDFRVATDRGRIVGTYRSFAQRVTTVGAGSVPTRGVTAVTVLPTHRRRGILTRLMADGLDDALADGAAAVTLIAAEYGIYGRFGFGPATDAAGFRIDVERAGLGPVGDVDLRFVTGADYLTASTAVHAGVVIPGKVSRPPTEGERRAGLLLADVPDTTHRVVLYRDDLPVGVVAYRVDELWEDNMPGSTLRVVELLGVDADAERTLWRFVGSVDWVTKVVTGPRPVDDVVGELAANPRAVVQRERSDHLWLRPLDVPAMFTARTFAAPGRLVLDVDDPGWGRGQGPAHGRFVIATEGGAGTCARTDEPADLALPVTSLPRLWTSDDTVTRRVAAGDVAEQTPGAAARADLLLFSPRRPWAVDGF